MRYGIWRIDALCMQLYAPDILSTIINLRGSRRGWREIGL